MKTAYIFIVLAVLVALNGCNSKHQTAIDWDSNDSIEYTVDYTVRFAADYDSTMQLTASSNYGNVEVAQVESENLIGEDGKPVKNTFIILEDSAPAGKGITLQRGGLSYTGGKPEFVHNHTVGSNDLVELRIQGSDDYTLYSIRDNMFFGPNYDEESFTIAGGQPFSIVLPVVTEEMYPKEKESHTIQIGFSIH